MSQKKQSNCCEQKQQQGNCDQNRKPYAKPKMQKHGNVETVTQTAIPTGPSGPIQET